MPNARVACARDASRARDDKSTPPPPRAVALFMIFFREIYCAKYIEEVGPHCALKSSTDLSRARARQRESESVK